MKRLICIVGLSIIFICMFAIPISDDEHIERHELEQIAENKSSTNIKRTTKYSNCAKERDLEKEIEKDIPELVSLGEFRLTAYCPCNICCGKWSGSPTASGVMPTENHTIAVDTNIIPFGTEVIINGKTYVAEDTGSAIKGSRIDIYMSSHQEALEFGVDYTEVFKIKK